MNLTKRIREALANPNFPDLKFLYSPEVLTLAPEVLETLLEEEKQDFDKKLQTPDGEITFETFEDFSLLDYFFGILEHYQGVNNDDVIRKIIEDFEPKYIDFGNEVSYSKRYYDMLKICYKNLQSLKPNLSQFSPARTDEIAQQLRILEQSIEAYEIRGIALSEEKKIKLKKINKQLSELSQKFSNNVLDSQKTFEYIIVDESIISEMPEDDRAVAQQRYREKYSIQKAKTDKEYEKCFKFFQKMWKDEFNIDIEQERFGKFKSNDIFYIGNDDTLVVAQIEKGSLSLLEKELDLQGIVEVDNIFLGRIGTLKSSRGRGLGSKIIQYIQDYYLQQGEKILYLPAAEGNIKYYEKFGFQTFGELRPCGNTNKIWMRSKLEPLTSYMKEEGSSEDYKNFLFDASQGAYISIMKYCSDSEVRKYFYEARNRFATEEKYNNKPVILETLKLRNKKAKLLGFQNYAELSLHFKMAESPKQIIDLFTDISQKAKPKGQAEIHEIQEYFHIKNIQVWDLSYYANKLREEKYSFDSKKLKKYLEFEQVLAGMFEVVKRLYGIEMKQLEIESYDPDIQIYEVYKDGKFLSYFFTDYFYRPLKRHGAWANIMREKFGENKKITLNVCNFQKGSDGRTLLTLSDVETMFHEFGHATHEMLSRSQYSELSGFHVEWDFVELPSQLLENWCRDRAGMKLFAKHIETGEYVPEEMLQKLEDLDTFGNGQMILTQNTYAMMDMGFHSENIPQTEEELDARVIANYELNALLPLSESYSPHTSFTHIFDGGYAAGYYSYMWAEIIEKEVWKAFKDSQDIFSPEISKKFHDTILSQGTTKKASELFRDFFGRDVEIDAFLEEKGLV